MVMATHVAAVCRREIPRCEKCARGHGTNECVISEENVVCCNCGGRQFCWVSEMSCVSETGIGCLGHETG
jgi:hypothetical protein